MTNTERIAALEEAYERLNEDFITLAQWLYDELVEQVKRIDRGVHELDDIVQDVDNRVTHAATSRRADVRDIVRELANHERRIREVEAGRSRRWGKK